MGAAGLAMKYVCPVHREVILYEDPPHTIADRILGIFLGIFAGTLVIIDKPRECPVDGHLYYRRECKQVPDETTRR